MRARVVEPWPKRGTSRTIGRMAAALITGVSRRRGIAAAVADRLRTDGWTVVTAGWTPYDSENQTELDEQAQTDFQCDLGDASEAMRLIAAAENKAGPLSALVLAHTPTAVVGCSK